MPGWLVALSLVFPAVMWMIHGVPDGHAARPAYSSTYPSSTTSDLLDPSFYDPDKNYNYPNVHGPNVRMPRVVCRNTRFC